MLAPSLHQRTCASTSHRSDVLGRPRKTSVTPGRVGALGEHAADCISNGVRYLKEHMWEGGQVNTEYHNPIAMKFILKTTQKFV